MLKKKHHIYFYNFYYSEIYNFKYFNPIDRIILLNYGSLTQNLNSITGKNIDISVINQEPQYNNSTIRKIWLHNSLHKLVFAESLWTNRKNKIHHITNHKTIGQNMITKEVDIYKNIDKLEYSYNYHFEKLFQKKSLFWSRQYIILCDKEPLISIKEILSRSFDSF